METKPKNILFVCTANSARSQIAEGFARKAAPEHISIYSGGIDPAITTHPLAVEAMNEFGINISKQQPKILQDLKSINFDLVVTLCENVKSVLPVFTGSPPVVHWMIQDPSSGSDSDETQTKQFIAIASQIKNLIDDLFHRGYSDTFFKMKENRDTILNNLAEGVLAHDIDRKIFYFSKGLEKLTGMKAADVLGQDCHEVFMPRFCGENCSFCSNDLIAPFDKKNYSTVFHSSDGERRECKVTVIPALDDDGNITSVVASFSDQTRLKSLSRELLKNKQFNSIIGNDHIMLEVFQQIRDVAFYDFPVHIYGETGTGKELVARAIHNESNRKDQPFVPINCGALPEGLIESELFGHVKGSFSGAIRDKKGRLELANNGTIFLDEVSELPVQTQVKLLRFLQEGTLEKVGSEKTVSVDVRVISATNKILKSEMKNRQFREDLFYRLNVIPVNLPLLKERRNDIPLLVEHFLVKSEERYGCNIPKISDEALSVMMSYSWPGNVRELENAIMFGIVKSDKETIKPQDLPMELEDIVYSTLTKGPSRKLNEESVRSGLVKAGYNKAKAARILGVGRATLYRFLDEHPELINETD